MGNHHLLVKIIWPSLHINIINKQGKRRITVNSIDQYTKLVLIWCNSNYQLTKLIAFNTEVISFSLDIFKSDIEIWVNAISRSWKNIMLVGTKLLCVYISLLWGEELLRQDSLIHDIIFLFIIKRGDIGKPASFHLFWIALLHSNTWQQQAEVWTWITHTSFKL